MFSWTSFIINNIKHTVCLNKSYYPGHKYEQPLKEISSVYIFYCTVLKMFFTDKRLCYSFKVNINIKLSRISMGK